MQHTLRMGDFLRQGRHRIRFDWAGQGASAVTVSADVAVVIDVLSFTTTLTVALDRGTTVLPYRWNDGGAADYARQHDAVLAVGRSEATAGQISLSPGTVRNASPPARLVLPSPNGSTIAHNLGRPAPPTRRARRRRPEPPVGAGWPAAWAGSGGPGCSGPAGHRGGCPLPAGWWRRRLRRRR